MTNKLNRIRRDRRMSQKELAILACATRQTISSLEHKGGSPSLDLAFRIARALGLAIEDIFEFEVPSQNTAPKG